MPLYITGLGMLLSVVLAIYSRLHFRGNIYLAIFFFLLNLEEFAIYALHFTHNPLLGSIVLFHFAPLYFLIGTSFYFYIRSLINNSARLYLKDLWHLAPALFIFVILFDYYFQSFDFKYNLAKEVNNSMYAYLYGYKTILPQSYINLLRAISMCGYTTYALWIYIRNLSTIRLHSHMTMSQRYSIELWLKVIFFISIVLSIIYIIASIQLIILHDIRLFKSFQFILSAVFLLLNVALLFLPQVLYGFPAYTAAMAYNMDKGEKSEIIKGNNTADLLLFTDEYIEEIKMKLAQLVAKGEFCNPDLSRSKLSQLTGIPLHHLSYFFSNVLNVKFTDWRNQLRIEHAKKLIASDLMKTMTLDAIASQSGFGNRQNFIVSFKKITTMTPSEYIVALKKDPEDA